MPTYNWKPVIQSLLEALVTAGYTLRGVDDGGEYSAIESQAAAIDAICSVDESTLHVISPNDKSQVLFLVLGNEPFETVCDYQGDAYLDDTLDAWSLTWEGRECPIEETTGQA